MQPANRSTQPLGIACLFMSLAILPFSLRAAGVDFGFTLSAATEAFQQMSDVVGAGFELSPESRLASIEPIDNEIQDHTDCPYSIASIAPHCNESVNTTTESVPEVRNLAPVEAQCPQALRKAKTNRTVASSKRIQVAVELPVQARMLTDLLELKSSLSMIPAAAVRCGMSAKPAVKVERFRNAARTAGWERELNFQFKVSPRTQTEQFRSPAPTPAKASNRSA